MKEKRFVKPVTPILVKKGQAVALLQNSGIRVVLLCLKVYLIHLGVDSVLIQSVKCHMLCVCSVASVRQVVIRTSVSVCERKNVFCVSSFND